LRIKNNILQQLFFILYHQFHQFYTIKLKSTKLLGEIMIRLLGEIMIRLLEEIMIRLLKDTIIELAD